MDLATAKDKVLILLDEYSSSGTVSVDADIALKMNLLFDNIQKHLATIKKIVKVYTVPVVNTGTSDYTTYAMPSDFYMLKQIWADMEQIGSGTWRGKSLVLDTDETRLIEVEYYAYPTDITLATADTYLFEIDSDAQELMPYFVASNVVLTDIMTNNQKILNVYEQMLQTLIDSIPKNIRVVSLDDYNLY